MDELSTQKLEEAQDVFPITSLSSFDPSLEALHQGLYTATEALLAVAKECEISSLRKPGNTLYVLIQECTQYQLIQKELSEMITHSTRLSTAMQAKINTITSLLTTLLTEYYNKEFYNREQTLAEQQVQLSLTLCDSGGLAPPSVSSSVPSVSLAPPSASLASAEPTPDEPLAEEPIASQSLMPKEVLLPTFSATCLRPFAVQIGNKPIELCSNRNGQAILRYLIAQPNHSASADTLKEILWPGDEADVSARKLQVTMSILRRSLNNSHEKPPKDGYILYKHHFYQLNPAIPLHIDVDDFLSLYSAGGQADKESVVSYYERACRIYTRPFLVEDIYADWSFTRREQLRQIHVSMCTDIAEHYLAAHIYSKAGHWARVIIEENRCDEVAYRLLMKAYALDGRRCDALQQFRRCEEVMQAELGIQPAPETISLYQAIASGQITAH